ncbi:hypothetical protein CLOM_g7013 [Closterium sp. NIES-68]|nr:hypothetical protein CLOM_g7013 [Closterium sp. NIES-68]GJP80509.1 hypothetical protein CLOP_g10714 [Closterium sp. NIES-67]
MHGARQGMRLQGVGSEGSTRYRPSHGARGEPTTAFASGAMRAPLWRSDARFPVLVAQRRESLSDRFHGAGQGMRLKGGGQYRRAGAVGRVTTCSIRTPTSHRIPSRIRLGSFRAPGIQFPHALKIGINSGTPSVIGFLNCGSSGAKLTVKATVSELLPLGSPSPERTLLHLPLLHLPLLPPSIRIAVRHVSAALLPVSTLLQRLFRALVLAALLIIGAAAVGERVTPAAVAATAESSATAMATATDETIQAGGLRNKRSRRVKANAFVRLAANRVAPAVVQLEVERQLPRSTAAQQAVSMGESSEEGDDATGHSAEEDERDGCNGNDVSFLARIGPLPVSGSQAAGSEAPNMPRLVSSWPHKPRVGVWLRRLRERGRHEAKTKAPEVYTETSVGSGFIISSTKRLVLTNAHVVDGAARVTLLLPDGQRFATELLVLNPSADLAVLKVTHRLPAKKPSAAPPSSLQGISEPALAGMSMEIRLVTGTQGRVGATMSGEGCRREESRAVGTGVRSISAEYEDAVDRCSTSNDCGDGWSSGAGNMGVREEEETVVGQMRAGGGSGVVGGDEEREVDRGGERRGERSETVEVRGFRKGEGRGEVEEGGGDTREEDWLPCAPIGDSDDVELADWVISVGNPVGLPGSISLGIVSSLHRTGAQVGVPHSTLHFFQTDCAINPGSSGSPLVNEFGEVIGITTAIRSDAEGVAFAIPINHAIRELRLLGFQL